MTDPLGWCIAAFVIVGFPTALCIAFLLLDDHEVQRHKKAMRAAMREVKR